MFNNIIKLALNEDIGRGDITSKATIAKNQSAEAIIIAKEAGIIAGLPVAKEVFHRVDRRIEFVPKVKDGARVKKGKIIAEVSGPARGIMAAERTALNFLQRLSGIATLTNQFVAKAGKKVKVLDTRKTSPGMRAVEKYAVKVGGGTNHRFGLYDEILIKDNHIKIACGIERAVGKAKREGWRKKQVEVEVKTIAELKEAIKAGADKILLDNMGVGMLRRAVKMCKKAKIWTEASGGVSLKTIGKIARTGVNAISVGALTHSAKALDISLEVD